MEQDLSKIPADEKKDNIKKNKTKKYIPIEERSERELQVSIANYLYSSHKSLSSIKSKINFFFWIFIIALIIGIISLVFMLMGLSSM